MKKSIILVGSARTGNSLFLARKIAEQNGAEIVQIATKNIAQCTGCLECDETQKCIFNDDMTSLIPKVVETDVVIIITPTRWGLLSGDVKVFIDRMNPIATTEELVGKQLIVVSIGQSEVGDTSIQHAVDSLVFFGESAGMELIGSFPIYECLAENDLSLKDDVAGKVVEDILELLR
jgi:multimeric flavodoxin WrbA